MDVHPVSKNLTMKDAMFPPKAGGFKPIGAKPTATGSARWERQDSFPSGFYYLEVKCRRCSTHSIVDLTAVNEVRRKPDTPIWKLEASLRCRHCSEALRGRRPAANIVRLRKEKTLEFEAWYPEDER
jgi:phage FluMu protein Com